MYLPAGRSQRSGGQPIRKSITSRATRRNYYGNREMGAIFLGKWLGKA